MREPLRFAALRSGAYRPEAGSRVLAIVSGGNVDPERAFTALGALSVNA